MASSIPNRGPELMGVDAAFMASAVIANALRCFTRIHMVKCFGTDDWLMAFSTVSFIAYCTSSMLGVHYGTGRHHSDLPLYNVQTATHCWWFCFLFYCTTMISSKVSIGCFLLRIAVKKIHSWIIYAAMFISIVAGTVFFFVTLFQCHPISYFWRKNQPGTCIKMDVIIGLAYLYSVFSIISDFTFAILPAFLVWNLQLKQRTKIALIPLLTMGCIASAAVVARVPYMERFRSPDFLWATLDIAIWSTVEQGLAITAGSLATLRPLFQLLTYKLGLSATLPSGMRPSNYGGYGGGYGPRSPAASQMLGSRRKPSQNDLDLYKLTAVAEARGSQETEPKQEEVDMTIPIKSPTPSWYHGNFCRSKQGSMSTKKEKVTSDNDSEKGLHAKDSQESLEQDLMHIMVSRTIQITNDPRKSERR